MKLKKISTIIGLCFWIVACTAPTQSIHVNLNYTSGADRANAEIESKKVDLSIAKLDIFDERVDKEHLGSTDAPIYGSGVVEWVHSGITSLSEFGYSFPALGEEGNTSGLSLQVHVNRVSCRGTVMNMRCTVVMEVDFFSDDILIQQKPYHGTQLEDKALAIYDTRHFGQTAVMRGLNAALEQCLIKFESDLREFGEKKGAS